MRSGTRDPASFYKRRNAVSGGNDDERNNQHELHRAHSVGVPENLPGTDRRKYKENKAKYLMPQRMDRLYGGWKYVLYELARVLRQMLVRHDFILSKVKLVPACQGLYNQVNISKCSTVRRDVFAVKCLAGNRWPCSCITESSRPDGERPMKGAERGRTSQKLDAGPGQRD